MKFIPTLWHCVARRAPFRQLPSLVRNRMSDRLRHILPLDTDIYLLDCGEAFASLTDRQKKYAHFLAQAAFHGSLACLFQVSSSSPEIFLLLHKMFRAQTPADLEKMAVDDLRFTEQEFKAVMMYSAGIYSNMGNYKAYGDTKFVPDLPKEKFAELIKKSAAAAAEPEVMEGLLKSVLDEMFSLDKLEKELGLPPKGKTTYFSKNCTAADADLAQEFLIAKGINPYNTRLFKTVDPETKKVVYEVWLASARTDDDEIPGYGKILGLNEFKRSNGNPPAMFCIRRGDHSKLMALVVEYLREAQKYTSNEKEDAMIEEYIQSFETGSLPAHINACRHWIHNKSPTVETYMAFLESYRDPSGFGVNGKELLAGPRPDDNGLDQPKTVVTVVSDPDGMGVSLRDWWWLSLPSMQKQPLLEGWTYSPEQEAHSNAFVGVKKKETSDKFARLVQASEELLKQMPWPGEFEKDRFLAPDFTSLQVLAYAGSSVYGAINVPNYDDIRQNEGFKNLYFENYFIPTRRRAMTFLAPGDRGHLVKWERETSHILVGLHELLGHGSGKFFIRDDKGDFNFDIDKVIHPVSGEKITSWYENGETYENKFGALAAGLEECRANSVALYLCFSPIVLNVFGHKGQDADDAIYALWLAAVRFGVLALQHYSPQTGKWGQAHAPGFFAILRVLMETGEDFVTVKEVMGEDGKPDFLLTMDRTKMESVGRPAIGKFVCGIQAYRSTGDGEGGKRLFEKYITFTEEEKPHFLRMRQIVLSRLVPRKMFVQHHTYIEEDKVKMKTFEPSSSGLVQSYGARFASPDIDNIIHELWEQQKHYF